MFDNYLRNVTNLKKIVLILHLNDQRYHMSEAYDNILCQVPTYKALNSTIQVFFAPLISGQVEKVSLRSNNNLKYNKLS